MIFSSIYSCDTFAEYPEVIKKVIEYLKENDFVNMEPGVYEIPEGYDKDFAIVGAPYLYDGIDHMEKVVLHGVFDDLFYSARKYNFQVLMVYTAGERNVYSNKPINSAADLAGQIIRVNDSPTYIEMTKLMGELVQPCLSQRFIQLCSRVSLMQLKTVSLYIMTLRTMKWQNIIHIQNILFIQTL